MRTAKQIPMKNTDWQGDARLYKLSEPVSYGECLWDDEAEKTETEFIVVSANTVVFSGPETYIFPADKDGVVLNWIELSGSFKGGLNHEEALRGAGYEME
jgi:hypothetical protein